MLLEDMSFLLTLVAFHSFVPEQQVVCVGNDNFLRKEKTPARYQRTAVALQK